MLIKWIIYFQSTITPHQGVLITCLHRVDSDSIQTAFMFPHFDTLQLYSEIYFSFLIFHHVGKKSNLHILHMWVQLVSEC